MRSVDLSYLADTLLTVKLRSGGPDWPLRNPSALEATEPAELYKLPTARERVLAMRDFFAKLLPADAKADVDAMPEIQMVKLLAAIALAAKAISDAAEDEFPNGKAGTASASVPATSLAMSPGGSPAPPDVAYGPS
jgi:hypothetical protein